MELWSETRRKVLVEGVSQREICRDYQLGWRTLEKILEHPEPPGYRSRVPRALPKLGPFVGLIDEMLESDRDAPPRQRPTARRIFHRLRDEHDYRAARFWSEAELGADRFPAVAGLPIDETFGGDRRAHPRAPTVRFGQWNWGVATAPRTYFEAGGQAATQLGGGFWAAGHAGRPAGGYSHAVPPRVGDSRPAHMTKLDKSAESAGPARRAAGGGAVARGWSAGIVVRPDARGRDPVGGSWLGFA